MFSNWMKCPRFKLNNLIRWYAEYTWKKKVKNMNLVVDELSLSNYNYFQGLRLLRWAKQDDWQLQIFYFLSRWINFSIEFWTQKFIKWKKNANCVAFLFKCFSVCMFFVLVEYGLHSKLFLLEMRNDDKLINLFAPTKLNYKTTPTRLTRRIVFFSCLAVFFSILIFLHNEATIYNTLIFW